MWLLSLHHDHHQLVIGASVRRLQLPATGRFQFVLGFLKSQNISVPHLIYVDDDKEDVTIASDKVQIRGIFPN